MVQKVVIGSATLYQGDALEILPTLPSGIDGLVTDPPYSSGGMMRGDRMQSTVTKYVQGGSEGAAHNVEFMGDNRDQRSWQYWMCLWLAAAQAKLKPGAYAMCFTDWRQLPVLTDAFQAGGMVWRGLIPWDKTESSRAPHKGYFRHQCEYVVWGSNGPLPAATHGGPWPGLVRQRVDHRQKLHMTGKPVELMSDLIQCVQPGGVILDPFMGSASTGIAALMQGRQFIGIEKSEHYFDVACKRVELQLLSASGTQTA